MERNIRLLIEYDGGRYDGWQRLGRGGGVTIQGKLEEVLRRMTGEEIELIGARTPVFMPGGRWLIFIPIAPWNVWKCVPI